MKIIIELEVPEFKIWGESYGITYWENSEECGSLYRSKEEALESAIEKRVREKKYNILGGC